MYGSDAPRDCATQVLGMTVVRQTYGRNAIYRAQAFQGCPMAAHESRQIILVDACKDSTDS